MARKNSTTIRNGVVQHTDDQGRFSGSYSLNAANGEEQAPGRPGEEPTFTEKYGKVGGVSAIVAGVGGGFGCVLYSVDWLYANTSQFVSLIGGMSAIVGWYFAITGSLAAARKVQEMRKR